MGAYQKKIQGDTLTITSPSQERAGRTVHFYSKNSKRNDVRLKYGKTLIKANQASIEETKNKIYLRGGFYSQYLDSEILGQNVVYNPFQNFFEAEDVTVRSKYTVSQAENFSYYGEKISMKKAKIGLDLIRLDIEFEQLDLYPGWVVAYGTKPQLFSVPFFYIPTMIEDRRRNSYRLPDPLPQAGKTFYRGDYWRWNSHYYINDFLYGNIQFGRAVEKGAGYGFQQVARFSDYDQFTYINENWQYGRTQEVFSFEHSFLNMPKPAKKNRLTFNELLQYNEEIKDLQANSFQLNRTRFEEINDEIIQRDYEFIYTGNFKLPWYKLKLYTMDSVADIEELTSEVSTKKYEFLSELGRDLEFPYIGMFTPGVGYDTIKYELRPYNWHRTYDYIEASRKFWFIECNGRATDYVDERGGSPFLYDQKFELSDNVKTSVFLLLWNIKLGQSVRYSTYNGAIFDIMYHFKLTTSAWTLKLDYSLRQVLWTAAVEMDVF